MDFYRFLQVTVTYIGAVIGAGFASGQEILQFFAIYGVEGLIGTIVTGMLFACLGITIILISYNLQVVDYYSLFYQLGGKKLGWLADLMLSLFLLGSLVVMLAGCKEIFNYFFNFKVNFGLLITVIIIIVANFHGLEGVMKLNSFLIPGLLFIIFTTIFAVNNNLNLNLDWNQFTYSSSWIASSFVYAGYNLILGLAILLPLTAKVKKKELIIGVGSGGLVLGGMAFLIGFTLQAFFSTVVNSEIPMLEIIGKYRIEFYYVYGLVLWLAMVTTASCNLYGIVIRIQELISVNRKKLVVGVLAFILPLIKLSFSHLVELIYPWLGKLSLGLISGLIITYLGGKIYQGNDAEKY